MSNIIKDPYSLEANGAIFQDYGNEYICLIWEMKSDRFTDEHVLQHLKDDPLKKCIERFAVYYQNSFSGMKETAIVHTRKVYRIDLMASLANQVKDITNLKRIFNELSHLLLGKSAPLYFPEEKFNPSLIELPWK